MKPRIALMAPRLGRYGGMEGFTWRLAEYLRDEYAVHVLCMQQDGRAPEGVQVVRLGRPLPGRAGKILWFALAAEWARRTGGYAAAMGMGATLFQDVLRISGAPTRRFWELTAPAYGHGWPRHAKMLRRWANPGHLLAMAVERLQLSGSRILVANSHLVRDLMRESFPQLQDRPIPVIYNAPDTSRFAPPSPQARARARSLWNIPPNCIALGTAATNFRLKGIFPLIESLRHLPQAVHLWVAGGRSPHQALAHARRHGLENRVHFLGRVDDMPLFYAALDGFVLNTFYDACANAVLEALATGLCTISTRWNGSSAFLAPEAIIEDPADPMQVARAIAANLGKSTQRPDFRPAMGLAPYRDLLGGLIQQKTRDALP
ncbi:MAG: glycosyltransferase family 4 protein [Desulfomicrobiaceae bacterium]|nr:glycosyltransferase family 4 protein [Desulfomicrobiaceae bacterium]